MANYIDGFVMVVPKKNLAAYKKMATKACKIWKEYGALDYVETVADDINTKFGLSFKKLTKLKKGETIVFAYIVYKSRKQRDDVNKKIMKDKRMNEMCDPNDMPFDICKMSYGGFNAIVEMKKKKK